MLDAHGGTKREWVYYDHGKEHTVQRWINSVDGKYSGLLICVCNPNIHTPTSKKSILMIPDHDIAIAKVGIDIGRNVCFDLYVPEKGIIDPYTIDYEIRQLKSNIKTQ